ncbi:maltose-6'-phosphate glucosidase [Brachyspira pilosicoli WesB]|uniref:Maltose-6'-phosphate glucosidase n=4 Tax=Brachyspira TaxID=29521 RepID=K0JL30_BRAPL|nr:6-phospho-alpha-glucosidase [Brachyspira pilosicoli]AFR70439.1 putative family 4 glycosyl hydrolase [Brachyspira pilosicoli B2904]CCG57070.1 maltose-6'-phosphate glucosidase [Brachyspira pilosicoli WesB]
MNKKHNIVIVGGGSTYTLGIIESFLAEKEYFDIAKISFFDTDEERQKIMAEASKIILKERAPDIEFYYTSKDKEKAYKDCDFAFIQIREGGLKMREMDEKIPLSLGCVGQETCGAGGISYGLRSIGSLFEIVRDIRKYSPNAWIVNYTNPAAIIALALNREFPNDKKIFNLCDMPLGIMEALANLIGKNANDFIPEYFGLNHYGWFTALYNKEGRNLMPDILKLLTKENIDTHKLNIEKSTEKSWEDTYSHLVTMCKDMPGSIPSTYFQYYLYPKKIVEKSDCNYTRANEVMDHREKIEFQKARQIISEQTSKNVQTIADLHGRYIIQVVNSLANNLGKTSIIIVPNNGTISCLPDDAMVEVDCYVDRRGPRPFNVKEISTFQKALLQNQYALESLVVESWYNADRQKLIEALALNRTVVNFNVAQKLADKLLEANKKWLPQFFN